MEQRIVFDYFYGGESEQFSFYRIPKQLVRGEYFKQLSTDAKLLYGMMLDRMELSAKNGWYDERGRVFVYYPLEEIQEAMNCGHDKATKMLVELSDDKGIGLIERVKQGLGRPAKIYVKQFVIPATSPPLPGVRESRSPDCGKTAVKSAEKSQSGVRENRSQECGKTAANYNNLNYTYVSQLNQSIHQSDDRPIDRQKCKERICSNIEYEWLSIRFDTSVMEQVDELVEIMVDAICDTAPALKIGKSKIPIEDVRRRLLSLDASHIEYVLERMKTTTAKVHNIHAYLLSALYRAPTTINHYYAAEVQHDQHGT